MPTVPGDPLQPLLGLAGVGAAAGQARAAVDALLANPMLRRRSAEVSSESALRGARASAALDGCDLPLDTVRAGGVDDPILAGALRASAAVGSLVGTWQYAPLQALARLHLLAAAGLLPDDELGRPTADPQRSARLATLAALVTGETAAPAVVVAAVVHGELLAVAPFRAANGTVARAAARLTMISRGLDPKAVGVPEVGHAEQVDEYVAAQHSFRIGGADGVARWMRHCCAAVERGAQEGLAVCEAMRRGVR